jgi:hypothetical protein
MANIWTKATIEVKLSELHMLTTRRLYRSVSPYKQLHSSYLDTQLLSAIRKRWASNISAREYIPVKAGSENFLRLVSFRSEVKHECGPQQWNVFICPIFRALIKSIIYR